MTSLQGPIRLFLSYASEDAGAVEELYDKLNHAPYEPWMDRRNILPGEDWRRSVERAQRQADFVLICLSRRSVAKRGFLQREIHEALEQWKEKLADDIYLIPIRLDDCEVPHELRQFQWTNLFDRQGFTVLLLSIRAGIERRRDTFVQDSQSTYLTKAILEVDTDGIAYEIKVNYPSFQPESDGCLKEINAVIYGLVLRYIAEEGRSVVNVDFRDELRERGWNSTQDFFGITFDVHLLTASLVSIVFTVLRNGAGAAHPLHWTRTLNFLRDPVRLVSIDNLSASRDFLSVISEYCYGDLASQLSENGLIQQTSQLRSVMEGTIPKGENFRAVVLTKEGATVFFDAYSIGPYAWGRREVRIPRSVIEPLLVPHIREIYSKVGGS